MGIPTAIYVLQSLMMGLVLSGYGLALGAEITPVQSTALAVGLFALQIGISHLTLRAFGQGPLERIWRRASTRALSPIKQPLQT